MRELLRHANDHFHPKGLTTIATAEAGYKTVYLLSFVDQQARMILPQIGVESYIDN